MAFIPDGVYKIHNVEFPKFVADLIDGIPRGPISGYQERPSNRNDKWRIRNVGGGGNQITIESVSTPGSFANAERLQGARLVGSEEEIIWNVVKLDADKYYIAVNVNYIWELPQGVDYANIRLVYHTGKRNTQWRFERVDA